MEIAEILEAFTAGPLPSISSADYQSSYGPLLASATKAADVRANLELFNYNNRIYLLVKDKTTIIANLNLSPVKIAGKQYLHVDGIFVREEFRKKQALYWLLYSVKEVLTLPLVADGAIFSDGQALILAIKKHSMFNAKRLDKNTGEKFPLTDLIHDYDSCYIFESTKLGFGIDFFKGTDLPFVWYPLFEELE